jgi:hypothetical protein
MTIDLSRIEKLNVDQHGRQVVDDLRRLLLEGNEVVIEGKGTLRVRTGEAPGEGCLSPAASLPLLAGRGGPHPERVLDGVG